LVKGKTLEKFNIAIIQLNQCKDINKNLEIGLEKCRKAKSIGADLVLFPEIYSIGYWFPNNENDIAIWKKQAISRNSCFINRYRTLAKELSISIAITFLKKRHNKYYNSLSLINYRGDCVLNYNKVHTCIFGDEKLCDSGNKFNICNLETQKGYIKIGAMICYDREFPESARILMIKGAEVIIVPNACELENNRIMQIGSRSFENMVGIAVANYSGNVCKGHSIAFDGIAFDKNGQTRDMRILEADENENDYLVEFNIKSLRDYRERETWGNSYRKPKLYRDLVKSKVRYPFIRNRAK
jgi:predicted amidohydrolase